MPRSTPRFQIYRVRLTERAERGLRRIRQGDPRAYERIKTAVGELATEPRPPGAIKLAGIKPPAWRLRVGQYRIAYEIDGRELVVLVINVAPRGEVYR